MQIPNNSCSIFENIFFEQLSLGLVLMPLMSLTLISDSLTISAQLALRMSSVRWLCSFLFSDPAQIYFSITQNLRIVCYLTHTSTIIHHIRKFFNNWKLFAIDTTMKIKLPNCVQHTFELELSRTVLNVSPEIKHATWSFQTT